MGLSAHEIRPHEESAAKVCAVGGIVGGGMDSFELAHFDEALCYVSLCALRAPPAGAFEARLANVT